MANCPNCGTADFYPSFYGKGECLTPSCELFSAEHFAKTLQMPVTKQDIAKEVDGLGITASPWWATGRTSTRTFPFNTATGAHTPQPNLAFSPSPLSVPMPTSSALDPNKVDGVKELLSQLEQTSLLDGIGFVVMPKQQRAEYLVRYNTVSWTNSRPHLDVCFVVCRGTTSLEFSAQNGSTRLTLL